MPWLLHRQPSALGAGRDRSIPSDLRRSARRRGRASPIFRSAAARASASAPRFAMTEAMLILATIAQRYRLRLKPGFRWSRRPDHAAAPQRAADAAGAAAKLKRKLRSRALAERLVAIQQKDASDKRLMKDITSRVGMALHHMQNARPVIATQDTKRGENLWRLPRGDSSLTLKPPQSTTIVSSNLVMLVLQVGDESEHFICRIFVFVNISDCKMADVVSNNARYTVHASLTDLNEYRGHGSCYHQKDKKKPTTPMREQKPKIIKCRRCRADSQRDKRHDSGDHRKPTIKPPIEYFLIYVVEKIRLRIGAGRFC